jgi:ADP-heptose:LPS heptosyltransferase
VPADGVVLAMSATAARPTLLVLRALGLGDLMTGVPAYRALADAFPEHRRILAAPLALAPLALHTGFFDTVHATRAPVPLDDLGPPALAVNLHGRGPASDRALLAARPARLIAFAHPDVPETAGGPAWDPDEHEVRRWCRLLAAHGIAADPGRLDVPPPDLPVPDGAAGATLVHPGAASGARRWPAARWAEVARAERHAGRAVFVTGSTTETALARDVAARAGLPDDAVLAGETDALSLAALVAVAGRVVCGDTGVAHLATAFATPSVVLFGPTSPARWGPPPGRPAHLALWAGRTGDPHGRVPDPGLLEITPADVIAAVTTLPSRIPPAPESPAPVPHGAAEAHP